MLPLTRGILYPVAETGKQRRLIHTPGLPRWPSPKTLGGRWSAQKCVDLPTARQPDAGRMCLGWECVPC